MKKVAAIVPAYNEAPRIAPVLKALSASSHIHEVIVVDDGSKDGIDEVMAEFPLIKYLKNDFNRGKGYSLERASRITDADILLFCDADLIDLTPEMLEKIITPVTSDQCDMFIGIYQTSFHGYFDKILRFTSFPAGINSGLRAVRKNVWESLPPFYKHKFKLESGLNYLVKWKFRGPLYGHMHYRQISKESKRGVKIRGIHTPNFSRYWRICSRAEKNESGNKNPKAGIIKPITKVRIVNKWTLEILTMFYYIKSR